MSAATGVEPGTRVRWWDGQRWCHGHLTATAQEGWAVSVAGADGAPHVLPADTVQVDATGPRGGRRWAACPLPARPARPAWDQEASRATQLGLFEGRR